MSDSFRIIYACCDIGNLILFAMFVYLVWKFVNWKIKEGGNK